MKTAFIDFEAFVDNDGSYIIKELCIMSLTDIFNPLYYLFFPTKSWRDFNYETNKTNKYLMTRHHKLQWYSGIELFCRECVMYAIETRYNLKTTIFYIMGSEYGKKMETITKLFPNLRIVGYNASYRDFKNVPSNITCFTNHGNKHCAYMKCLKLVQHYIECD